MSFKQDIGFEIYLYGEIKGICCNKSRLEQVHWQSRLQGQAPVQQRDPK
jgi:hypothetical protein